MSNTRTPYRPEVGAIARVQGEEGPWAVVEVRSVGTTGKQFRADLIRQGDGLKITGIAVSKLSPWREKAVTTVDNLPYAPRVAEPNEDGKVHPAMSAARFLTIEGGRPLVAAEVLDTVNLALRRGTATAHREAASTLLTLAPLSLFTLNGESVLGRIKRIFGVPETAEEAITRHLIRAAVAHAREANAIDAE